MTDKEEEYCAIVAALRALMEMENYSDPKLIKEMMAELLDKQNLCELGLSKETQDFLNYDNRTAN